MANTKQNNVHKPHPTRCAACDRALPKRAYRRLCATCLKREQDTPVTGPV